MRTEAEIRQAIADLDVAQHNVTKDAGSLLLNRATADAFRWVLGENGAVCGKFLSQLRELIRQHQQAATS